MKIRGGEIVLVRRKVSPWRVPSRRLRVYARLHCEDFCPLNWINAVNSLRLKNYARARKMEITHATYIHVSRQSFLRTWTQYRIIGEDVPPSVFMYDVFGVILFYFYFSVLQVCTYLMFFVDKYIRWIERLPVHPSYHRHHYRRRRENT